MQSTFNRSLATRIVVVFTTTLTSAVGLIILLGLIFGNVPFSIPNAVPVLGGITGSIPSGNIAFFLVRIAVITLSLAILVGVINLVLVNAQRALQGRTITSRVNSVVVLLMFLVGIFAQTSNSELNTFLLEDIQTTIESSLAALLFFALVYGAFRILKRQVTPWAILFVLTVEIVLIGALPNFFFEPVRQFSDWLFNVPVNAGARGILLGIALATLITGLRVLIGQDRTYGE